MPRQLGPGGTQLPRHMGPPGTHNGGGGGGTRMPVTPAYFTYEYRKIGDPILSKNCDACSGALNSSESWFVFV